MASDYFYCTSNLKLSGLVAFLAFALNLIVLVFREDSVYSSYTIVSIGCPLVE